MTENIVVVLRQKEAIDDPLTEISRAGAKRLIAQAVEPEFEAFLAVHASQVLPDGRQRVVRHGHGPARMIQTGIGPVEVKKRNLAQKEWKMPPREWAMAKAQFAILFQDRFRLV